ncbi:iron-containing redox enzyme family protein [Streptomyces polygonati]|uniref:Iron-containing redox enzyme family protein n=1 Tax=Streptomyces polygonati TaxID=1617087 RepID=A0ABV8HTQ1_9ACTN
MTTTPADSDLKRLFVYNRSVPDLETFTRITAIEHDWIEPLIAGLAERTAPVASRAAWVERLAGLLAAEREPSPAGRYLAEKATREEFALVVREFGLDGLTEAQNFFPAVPRLPIRSQMAVMRVLIDEFGCGNLQQAHSQLYLNLLGELGLPRTVDDLLDLTSDETFAFLDVFFWLTQRAPHIEYFLGALAYLEASIPAAFTVQARACERLGIENGRYYTEHLHIDLFHMEEMQVAIREYEAVHPLDATKLWIGATLLSELLGTAFDSAVERAREAA